MRLEYIRREDMKDLPPDQLAWACRVNALYMVAKAGRGHLGTSLSSMEAILAIRKLMGENDVFIGSKGHDAAAQYAVLVSLGILEEELVPTFRQNQTPSLPGHPELGTSGIYANSGSLGMGLSKAIGFARRGQGVVYVLLGDGEMMEGQNWEAVLFAKKKKVENIIALVDCNELSQDGPVFLNIDQIFNMFRGAGWTTIVVKNGNNYQDVWMALVNMRNKIELGPTAILLHTTKGYGILEFHDKAQSHAGPPNDYIKALLNLKGMLPLDMQYTQGDEYVYSPKSRHPLSAAFGAAVMEVLKENPEVVVLGMDTLDDHGLVADGRRIIDCGIAEQNAVSMASGLALDGFKPIVVTYARFLSRAHEQIYNQTTEGTAVVYVGSMAGLLPPEGPGKSHESLNDGVVMGTMMQVLSPQKEGVAGALKWGVDSSLPLYIRLMQQ